MLCMYKPFNEYYSKVLQWLVAMSNNFSSYQTALRLWIESLQFPQLCMSTHSISAQKALTSPHLCSHTISTPTNHRLNNPLFLQYIMLLPTAHPEHAFIVAKQKKIVTVCGYSSMLIRLCLLYSPFFSLGALGSAGWGLPNPGAP